MKKYVSHLGFLIFIFCISVETTAQTNNKQSSHSLKQLQTNKKHGVKVSPNATNLVKAIPKTVIQIKIDSTVVRPKPPKPVKVNKYNNDKAKRDED